MRKEKTAMIGSETLKPCAGVNMEMIGDKTRTRDMRASPANKLKPCPFCGGEAFLSSANHDDVVGEKIAPVRYFMVRCTLCGASGFYTHVREIAVTSWNCRADGALSEMQNRAQEIRSVLKDVTQKIHEVLNGE